MNLLVFQNPYEVFQFFLRYQKKFEQRKKKMKKFVPVLKNQ